MLNLIRKLGEKGYAVILISHNMYEVFQLAQRVSVMRQGKVVATVSTGDVTPHDVVALITGAGEIAG